MSQALLNVLQEQKQYDPYREIRAPLEARFSNALLFRTAFKSAQDEGFGATLGRFAFVDPLAADERLSPLLSPSDAKEKYGVETGNDWLTEAQVNELAYQKRKESGRAAILSASSGFWNKTATIGGSLAGAFSDPVMVALSLIPVVPEAKYAMILSKLAGAERAAKIARLSMGAEFGLGASRAVLEEAAGGGAKWGARFIAGGIEGGAGTAAYVPVDWWLKSQEGKDFSTTEGYKSIFIGAMLGAFLHTGLGAFRDVMTPASGRAMLREAVRALDGDQVPNFETIHALDEVRVWREQVDALGNERPEYRPIADEILRGRWPPLKPAPLMIVPKGEVPMPEGRFLSADAKSPSLLEVADRKALPEPPPRELPGTTGRSTREQFKQFHERVMRRVVAEEQGHQILGWLDDKSISPIQVVNDFFDHHYDLLTPEAKAKVEKYIFNLTGMKPGDVIAYKPSTGEKFYAKDWRGIIQDSDLIGKNVDDLEGSVRGLVVLMAYENYFKKNLNAIVKRKPSVKMISAVPDYSAPKPTAVDVDVRVPKKALPDGGPVIDSEYEHLSTITITSEKWKQLAGEEKQRMMIEEDFKKSFNRDLPERIKARENEIINSLNLKKLERDLSTFERTFADQRMESQKAAEQVDPEDPAFLDNQAKQAEQLGNDLVDEFKNTLDESDLTAIQAHDEKISALESQDKAIDVGLNCVMSHA